ncbi:MAG TPA: glycosyltransferase [Candidatus Binatia bacterium]|nr:glycosyltransferase [Candidatus Binatia bacterium]
MAAESSRSRASLGSVDIIIKTFLRPDCLRRLVDSILSRYPDACVSIADDGNPDQPTLEYYEDLRRRGHQVLLLPFHVGTSAGRNALVDATSRPFLLLLDDDFVFTEQTRVESLVEVLEADPNIGVASGALLDDGITLRRYEHRLRLEDGILHYDPILSAPRTIAGHACLDADIVLNFALFRREVFADVRWDHELKTVEHTDFFLRLARTRWRVVHVEGVLADHHRQAPADYQRYRTDLRSDAIVRRKWGIEATLSHQPSDADQARRVRRAHLVAAWAALKQGRMIAAARRILRSAAAGA